jgi:hypothetical protein
VPRRRSWIISSQIDQSNSSLSVGSGVDGTIHYDHLRRLLGKDFLRNFARISERHFISSLEAAEQGSEMHFHYS